MFNVDGSYVDADEMTYRQFMDVINMSLTNNLPKDDDADGQISSQEYFKAISTADLMGETSLDYKGRVTFKDLGTTDTKAQMTLYDTNNPSSLKFQANSALEISDPKTDMFKQLDEAIEAVRLGRFRADGENNSNPRNLGIQNGIQIIDDLSSHITRVHSKIGALSNSLNNSMQRSELLEVSTKTLRSYVIDTDIAEATLKLNQLTLNYQAVLSSIGRVSKLSLVNYM
jgi:flagellar hook-associated protein 3 FlgL